MRFPKKLENKLILRAEKNAFRKLSSEILTHDFTSNDYLGFAQNELIYRQASLLAKKKIKNGSTGSRLLSGNSSYYTLLEEQLADYYGSESVLLFNSGYNANIGFFSSVPQRNDIVFYDELIHASIREGITLSKAKAYKFAHNSLDDLKHKIELAVSQGDIYVVIESVFSMDGDSPDIAAFVDLCHKKNVFLIVDEAHAVGVFGKGFISDLKLTDRVFATVVTFGKALGCHGAAILGSRRLRDYLINFSRALIYTTALSPHSLATIEIAHKYLQNTDFRNMLFANISHFVEQTKKLKLTNNFIPSTSAVQSCVIPEGNSVARHIANNLRANGFDVRAILSPTVSQGKERLRFCIHSYNTKKEITEVLELLKSQL